MNLIALTIASIAIGQAAPVYAVDGCDPILSRHTEELELFGRQVPVSIVNGPTDEETIHQIIPDLLPSDVVAVFEAGHVYLLYQNGRYDGSIPDPVSLIAGNAKIRHTKLELARGIVVRLRNLTPDVQSRL